MTGKVKSFSPQHGYGFIVADDKDYFFHILDWKSDDSPAVGMNVLFSIYESRKGVRAKNIRRISHGK